MIGVLLVDDQDLVRAGLRQILAPRYGFDVVGEADDGAAALAFLGTARPDLVVMDVRMRGMDGIEATRRIVGLDDSPPVLVLTTFGEDEILSGALRAGASGFQLKDAAGEDLVAAARAVAGGQGWLDPAVTGRVLASYRAGAPSREAVARDLALLTAREVEVLRLIGRGDTNAEIADALYIGEGTVKTHIGHLFTKLGLRDRAAAVVFAFDHGLVLPQPGISPWS
ncbi:MAG: response regulator transcription factor [Acidimicrobiaceae bacterium]|nr:response regulator transcription factor [Acidimicrobiaceae bacterium]